MNFLRNLTVSLFSFLLFLSLTVFGFAFTLNSTVLNPDFVTAEINRLEITPLIKDNVKVDPPPEIPNLNEIIYKTVSDIEPQFKVQIGSAIHSVYDYLLGKTPEPHLALTLRNTFLSTDFVTPLVNSIDIPALAEPFLSKYFADATPIVIPNLDKYIKDVLTETEPAVKEQLINVSGPVFDYLLGITPTLTASVSLQQINESLKKVLLDAPLPDVGGISKSTIQDFLVQIPATFPIDESVIPPTVRTDIASGIANAEEGLVPARKYVAYFQQGYTLLIIFMAILVLGIILIVRNIKDITHLLGIPLVTYGAMEYGGIWVSKYLISSGKIQLPQMAPQLHTWLLQFINNMLRPLEIFSLTLLAAGVVLVVISFVYKPKKDLTWE